MAITAAEAAVALSAAGAEAKAQAPVAVQEEPPVPTPALQVAAVRADRAVGTPAGVAPERLRLEDRLTILGAAVVQVEAPVAATVVWVGGQEREVLEMVDPKATAAAVVP